ncbi:uridine kinase [Rhodococcus sp. (in: high G+C Gram-positive bacteria)]|uniref:uridine kinase n=2 Tax=Nocardiaceae TaxID=85025 RepID=UPI002591211B|nr:uridine kinase [Rhodococcus sp. (in: high G+C Gram-positive bacteria)]MCX6475856.1 uridine kinase [Rhodococcus sp. (in: high G+C Gram-positive bacteria)]
MSTKTVFETLAAEISALRGSPVVAIDGVDGSGKTTFTKSLAAQLNERPAIVIHVDDFLNPPEIRHRRGRLSPEGFWLDSYDYDALERHVLAPLRPGGNREYRPRRDSDAYLHAADGAVVLVEGLFLHRDEFASRWDYSIFLDVPFEITAERMNLRDGTNADPEHPSMNRYVGGQRLYFAAAEPWTRADSVIDNSDPKLPRITTHAAHWSWQSASPAPRFIGALWM